MTNEKVVEVVDQYNKLLWERDPQSTPTRMIVEDGFRPALSTQINHLRWMCGETATLARDGKTDKAMRWLGFLQGAMWALHLRLIDEMRRDNMPADAAFLERK